MALDLNKDKKITITVDSKVLFWPGMFMVWFVLMWGTYLFGGNYQIEHSGPIITKYTEVQSSESDSSKIETVYRAIIDDRATGKMDSVSITAVTFHTSKVGNILTRTEYRQDNPFWGSVFWFFTVFMWPVIMIVAFFVRLSND